MADTLTIHDLKSECRLGVYDWEREKPQPVWIDLELPIDASRAAARDDVRDALDYARLVTMVTTAVRQKPYALLETLAEELAEVVLREFRVAAVRVRVKKKALPGMDYAAVDIERTRRDVLRRRRLATPRAARRSPERAPVE
jgi:dihydroneopterin aldolase